MIDPQATVDHRTQEAWASVQRMVHRFEDAWRCASPPELDGYLAGSGQQRGELLRELVHLDLQYRIAAGESARVEDYLGRYPELTADRQCVLELLETERAARQKHGAPLRPEELSRGFPDLTGALAMRCDAALADDTDAIGGNFEILGELGRGGMGRVYKARQRSLDRLVALKTIRSDLVGEPRVRERFVREAATAARLRHPNVVQIHAVGEAGSRPYIAMEYVDGRSLADVYRGQRVAPVEAARIVETLARAVDYANGQGVVHRDLKPANVLVAADGLLKIADFGLAKRLTDPAGYTAAEEMLGTPAYMAPEQADGTHGHVGPATDVYGLGGILFELLAGRPAFSGSSGMDTIRKVLSTEASFPPAARRSIPRDLQVIALKCLSKDPQQRYASAGHLADDLRRMLEGRPIAARSVGPLRRLGKWCRRRPATTAAIVLGLSTLLAVAGGMWSADRARRANVAERLDEAGGLIELAERHEPFAGARSELVEELLGRIEKLLTSLEDSGDTSPRVGLTRAQLELAFARLHLRLNNTTAAAQRTHNSIDLLQQLPDSPELQPMRTAALGQAYETLGRIQLLQGHISESAASHERSLALREERLAGEPEDPKGRADVAASHFQLGNVLTYLAKEPAALHEHRQALRIRSQLADELALAPWQRDHARSLIAVGDSLERGGDLPAAVDAYVQALDVLKSISRDDPDTARVQIQTQVELGPLYIKQGEASRAIEQYDAAVAAAQRYEVSHPEDVWWRRQLLVARLRRAHLFNTSASPPVALKNNLAILAELNTVVSQLITEDPLNVDWRGLQWVALVDEARWRGALAGLDVDSQQNDAAAEDALRRALAVVDQFDPLDEQEILWPNRRALVHDQMAELFSTQERNVEADEQRRLAEEIRDRLPKGAGPSNDAPATTAVQSDWIDIETLVADVREAQPSVRPVRKIIGQMLEIYRQAPDEASAVSVVESLRNFARLLRQRDSRTCRLEADRLLGQGRQLLIELRDQGMLSATNQPLLKQLEEEIDASTR